MLTIAELAAEELGSFLSSDFHRAFGSSENRLGELVNSVARLAIETIANCDALYHDFRHTTLVALAGRDILQGRLLREAIGPSDWAHFLIACLMHDIGYVRGVLDGDGEDTFVIDASGATVTLPRGSSDAALTPYHVDRSKLFVAERFSGSELIDAARISRMVEFTRFPAPATLADADLDLETGLVRAADLIGQLGDALYLKKTNALYHEFVEIGVAEQLGYGSPADLIDAYPAFFWASVSDQIGPALKHLKATASGRRWAAQLRSNIFAAQGHLC